MSTEKTKQMPPDRIRHELRVVGARNGALVPHLRRVEEYNSGHQVVPFRLLGDSHERLDKRFPTPYWSWQPLTPTAPLERLGIHTSWAPGRQLTETERLTLLGELLGHISEREMDTALRFLRRFRLPPSNPGPLDRDTTAESPTGSPLASGVSRQEHKSSHWPGRYRYRLVGLQNLQLVAQLEQVREIGDRAKHRHIVIGGEQLSLGVRFPPQWQQWQWLSPEHPRQTITIPQFDQRGNFLPDEQRTGLLQQLAAHHLPRQELVIANAFLQRFRLPPSAPASLGKRAESRGGELAALTENHSDEGDHGMARPPPPRRLRSSIDNLQHGMRYYRLIGRRHGQLVAQLRTGARVYHFGYPPPELDEQFRSPPWNAWQRLTPATNYDLVPVRAFPNGGALTLRRAEIDRLLAQIAHHVTPSTEEDINARRFLLAFRLPRRPRPAPDPRLTKRGHALRPPPRQHGHAQRQRWIRILGRGRDGRLFAEVQFVDGPQRQSARHPRYRDDLEFVRAVERRFPLPYADWHSLALTHGAHAYDDVHIVSPDARLDLAIPFEQQHELASWIAGLRARGRLDDMEVHMAQSFILNYRLPPSRGTGSVSPSSE